jgi:hypothetical protein
MLSTSGRTRVAVALVGAALAATVAAPGPVAAQDMRTPDSLDGAARSSPPDGGGATTYPDLRTPDARDPGEQASPSDDQRSPDARYVPLPTLDAPPVASEPPAQGGFDVISAAIGAIAGAGLLIVLMALLGAGGLPGRRRHGTLGA